MDCYGVIYGLFHPRTDELRYVGQTVRPPQKRLTSHLVPSTLKHDSHRDRWIKILLNQGLKPTIKVIQKYSTASELNKAEIYWIAYFRNFGCRLTNITNGGGGTSGWKASEETRMRRSQTQKGQKRSEEARRNISEAGKGRKLSEEHKHNISEGVKGTKHSEETCRNMSIAATKRGISFETRKKMADGHKGKRYKRTKPLTPVHRENMSVAHGSRPFNGPDGKVWINQSEAAKHYTVCRSALSGVLRGDRKHTKGLTFKYVE